MSAWSVTCPRCGGDGSVKCRVPRMDDPEKYQYAEADCPLCSGTGQASMMEKMARRGVAKRKTPERDVA